MKTKVDVAGLRLGLIDSATLVGLSPKWVRTLVQEGFIPEPDAQGRYLATEVAQGALRAKDAKQRETTKSASASRAQDKRAQLLEIQIAKEERRLVDIEDAIGAMDDLVGAVKSTMSGVPARCSADIAVRAKIETELGHALNAAADLVASQAAALRSGGEPPSHGSGDDA